jgi:hypothetical protein
MILILLLVITIIIYRILNKRKAYLRLYNTLIDIASIDNVVEIKKCKAFDYEVKYKDKIYLIKMIYHPACYEINVNSKDYFQVNVGAVSSRKSGEKMNNVYDLMNFNLEENNYPKNTVKLYVIYPYSKTLLKVLNECDYQFIKPNTNLYGCKMTNFTELKENFDLF